MSSLNPESADICTSQNPHFASRSDLEDLKKKKKKKSDVLGENSVDQHHDTRHQLQPPDTLNSLYNAHQAMELKICLKFKMGENSFREADSVEISFWKRCSLEIDTCPLCPSGLAHITPNLDPHICNSFAYVSASWQYFEHFSSSPCIRSSWGCYWNSVLMCFVFPAISKWSHELGTSSKKVQHVIYFHLFPVLYPISFKISVKF